MPIASPDEPSCDCPLCPRLVHLRHEQRALHPDWHNAPVASFGDAGAWLAIVGLAPGLRGANRTGRPFTGDFAGDLLYETLIRHGLARGRYMGSPDDGLTLDGAIIVNAVRCLPPQNKPTPEEIRNCLPFLKQSLAALPNVRVMVALGQIAHQSAVRACDSRPSAYRFAHLAEHVLPGGVRLVDSYHCSRYNQNTGRLTVEMFDAVFTQAVARKQTRPPPI